MKMQIFKKIAFLGIGAIILSTLNGCSSNDKDSVNVSLSVPAIKHKAKEKVFSRISVMGGGVETAPFAPEDISGFDCLLVNVVGPGIGAWNENKDRVGAGKSFSYIGIYSQLISVATGGEVKVRVKKGSSRVIQLIGVRTADGLCPIQVTESQLSDTAQFPGLFIVGSQQKDIFEAQEVVVKNTYSVTEATDIRGSESQPNPPNVDKNPPVVPSPGTNGNIAQGEVGLNSIELTWLSASDRGTIDAQLKYKIVMTSDENNNLTTDAELAAATLVMDWTSGGPGSYLVTGLQPETSYRFQVLVKDTSNNISVYSSKSGTTANRPRYTITYHKNDDAAVGTTPTDATQYLTGEKITVASGAALSKADYYFAGWNTHPAGSGVSYKADDQITVAGASVNLYAQWILVPRYTITYHKNDDLAVGTAPVDTATYLSGAKITVASGSSLSKAEYLFNGWNTVAAGTGVSYEAGSQITVTNANLNLYAQWVSHPSCTCSDGYYLSGGSCVPAPNGQWATNCNLTACANKPANSSYLGIGAESAACPWTCDNNYLPNNSFTACEPNNGQIALSCAANQLVVGLIGRSGSWLDKVGVRCQNTQNGALSGSPSSGVEYGGTGGGPFSQDCPSGYAVYRIDYGNKDANTAGVIRFWCRKVSDGTLLAESYPVGGGYYGDPVNASSIQSMTCQSPYYVNWFTMGSAGAYAGPFSGAFGCRAIVASTGLLAYWQLDNSGSDSSGNSRTLTYFGGSSYDSTIKKFGSYSANLNGTNYLDSGVPILNGLSQFSMGGWVNVRSRGAAGSQVSFWGQNDLIEMGFNASGHSDDVCFWVNGGTEVCSPSKLVIGNWYHIMVTVDSANTKLYINGNLERTDAISTVGQSSGYSFKIGAGVWGPSGSHLDGFVDDVIIYNRALTEAEVLQIYGQ